MGTPRTLSQKVWDRHVVRTGDGLPDLLYIDLHLVHEVTSPQAFDGLRLAGRTVRRPDLTIATMDHNVPTIGIDQPINDPISAKQMQVLAANCDEFGITCYAMGDPGQGIVHIIGPEKGLTQPGMTIVCGDSHTSTHGAFGALAFGIGTSEVEHVLATQTLLQDRPRTMTIEVKGALPPGVTAKDIILGIIGTIGTDGATGYAVEYRGEAVRGLSMEGRMTVCNMSIEAGARAGMIAPDATTYAYIEGRPRAPKGAAWDMARAYWETLPTDAGAHFDREVRLDGGNLPPVVTWGSSPEDVVAVTGSVPDPDLIEDENKRASKRRALRYMGLTPGTRMTDIRLDRIFIGSCTNGRMEDLRAAAKVVEGRHINENLTAMVVPGSGLVKEQAEAEGLDRVFKAAGFEWRG